MLIAITEISILRQSREERSYEKSRQSVENSLVVTLDDRLKLAILRSYALCSLLTGGVVALEFQETLFTHELSTQYTLHRPRVTTLLLIVPWKNFSRSYIVKMTVTLIM